MTTPASNPNFVVFRSNHLDQDVCSTDLARLEEEELQILYLEASKVAGECLAGYEWSRSSLSNEWPDEDWPRRVNKKAHLVGRFVKLVASEIKGRRQKRQLEALELKTEAQAARLIKMRYIKAALRERFGYEITKEVLARAEQIAESKKSLPPSASELEAQ
jgi:hypothetical protein